MSVIRSIQYLTAVILLSVSTGCSAVVKYYQTRSNPPVSLRGYDEEQILIVFRRSLPEMKDYVRLRKNRVSVSCPEGWEHVAGELMDYTDRMYTMVEDRIGMRWEFDTHLVCFPVSKLPSRYNFYNRVSEDTMTLPLFIQKDRRSIQEIAEDNAFFPGPFSHELTEATLILPPKGKPPLLLDWGLKLWGLTLLRGTYHTRWFRDGLAEYVNVIVEDELGIKRLSHSALGLSETGRDIFEWPQYCSDVWRGLFVREYYDASLHFFHLVVEKHGEEFLKKWYHSLDRYDRVSRKELFDTYEKLTGTHPYDIVDAFSVPWLGVAIEERLDGKEFIFVVDSVIKGSPAKQGGLREADRILRYDRNRFSKLEDFLYYLVSKKKVGDTLELVVRRGDSEMHFSLILKSRPRTTKEEREDDRWEKKHRETEQKKGGWLFHRTRDGGMMVAF